MPTRIDHYGIALMDNLQADINEVRLDENLRIVRLNLLTDPRAEILLGKDTLRTARQIQTKRKPMNGPFSIIPYKPSNLTPIVQRIPELSNHALEWHFDGEIKDPFNDYYDRDIAMKLFTDVITSLRLLKPGLVGRFGASHIIHGDPSGLEGPWSKSETLNYEPSLMNMHRRYRFLREDCSNLKRTFETVSQCQNEQIRIALSRFDRQYATEGEADKLIDVMIGFESLYLRHVDSELKFRLATRAALHLGKNTNERRKVYDCLSTAYALRSQVVHGETGDLRGHKLLKKGGWASPVAILEQLSSYLRQALLSILLDIGTQHFTKDYHKKLDDALITGEEFLPNFSKGT